MPMATVPEDADVGDRGPVVVPGSNVLVSSGDDNGCVVTDGPDGGGVLTPVLDDW